MSKVTGSSPIDADLWLGFWIDFYPVIFATPHASLGMQIRLKCFQQFMSPIRPRLSNQTGI